MKLWKFKEARGQPSTEGTYMTVACGFLWIEACRDLAMFSLFQTLPKPGAFPYFDRYSAQVWLEHWFDHQPNDETAQQQKSGGGGGMESSEGEGHSEGGAGGEYELETKWKMVWFTKNALCQSWKRIDKEKRKKREKKEWKSERLINGQPQSNTGKLLHVRRDQISSYRRL